LAQEFVCDLLERGSFGGLDRARGKFRSFLLACLNKLLAKDWRGRNTQKRGGNVHFVPMDGDESEERYGCELAAETDPVAGFDRQWAMTLLDQAMTALRADQGDAGKGREFDVLRGFLTLAPPDGSYAEAAARLQTTVGAVTTAVHRLRHRYRELVCEAVAQTVNTPLELEEEMRHLRQVLSK
jgi:RNA polymerase sigma-70 factor (ECF subfamily)